MVSMYLFILTLHDADAISHSHQLGGVYLTSAMVIEVLYFAQTAHEDRCTCMISNWHHKQGLTGCDHELKFNHVIEFSIAKVSTLISHVVLPYVISS